MRVPPKANRIPATETLGAMGWSLWAGAPGSIRVAVAAEVEFCVEGLGLETIGEGTVAVVAAGGAA